MNNTALGVEEIAQQPESEKVGAQPGKSLGIIMPPFDPEAAIAFLDSLRNGDPEEQRETFAVL